MKSKRSKAVLLAAVLAVNGLLVIDGGSARPILAQEYQDTELEIGMKVGEGDILFAPEWYWNFMGMIIRYTDEDGKLMDTKFSNMNEKNYTIPAYSAIWENTAIPQGKVFDCWEVVKKPQKNTYQVIWELKRVVKDAVGENPEPSNEVIPSEEPKPSNEVKPSEKPKPSNEVIPSEEPKPSNEVKPSEEPKPSNEVKPSEEPKPSNEVKSSEEPKPSNEVKPSEEPKPSNEVTPSEEPKSSSEVKPSKEPKPSDEIKASETIKPSEAVKPGPTPGLSEVVKPNEPVKPSVTVNPAVQSIQIPQSNHTFLPQMDTDSAQTTTLLQTAAVESNQRLSAKKTTNTTKKQAVLDTVIYAGTYSLETGTTYTLGGTLKLEGDITEYAQGIQFQVKAGGSFTFR